MTKINQEEYEVLKNIVDKWKWIARDNKGYGTKLKAHTSRPYKMTDSHWSNGDMTLELLGREHLFQFIQWEDSEPYNIAGLIEEYEKDYKGSWEHAIEFSGEVFGESEETEVKNKVELKSWFEDDKLYVGEYVKHKINQLDEPEVLSQEWINEHKESWQDLSVTGYSVPEKDLQNLLVPKESLGNSQKLEKVQIPQFVADFIEVRKGTDAYSLKYILCVAVERSEQEEYTKAYDWISANDELFARAWLDGYEVAEEREQKYYAKIKGHENIGSNDKYWNYNTDMEELSIGDSEVHPNVISEYTIKATKDEWANLGINDDNADFVKVEELEE